MGASGSAVSWASSPLLLYIGIAITILIVLGLIALLIFVIKVRNECHEAIAKRFKDIDIILRDNAAVYFGRESQKYKQIRGNGVLVLTKNELFFRRFAPKMELSIPLKYIQDIEAPSMFLGKSIHKPLLKIIYQTETGEPDSAAWYVNDLESFKKHIEIQLKTT